MSGYLLAWEYKFYYNNEEGVSNVAKKNKNSKPNTDEALHVSDRIEVSILQQLKDKKKQLAAAEDIRQKQEEERKIRERREREKNKSFEELLNESGLSWKDYK